MKKFTSLLLSLLLVISIASCGRQNISTDVSAASTGTAQNIELTFWYSWADKVQENNLALTEEFNNTIGKAQGIHITSEYQGTYVELHQKLQSAYVANTMPAVSVMEIAFPNLLLKMA